MKFPSIRTQCKIFEDNSQILQSEIEFEDLKECEFVFVMVPTPFDCSKNKVDLTAVEESLDKLYNLNFRNIVIIKSTVPTG